MSKINFQPPPERNIRKMNRAEILQLFAWYDFKDALGHEIINCQDFLELVELAVSSADKSEFQNQTQVSV
jgi:hypothetical protein